RRGTVQALHQRGQLLDEGPVKIDDGAVGAGQGLLQLLTGLARGGKQGGHVLAAVPKGGGAVFQVGQRVLDAGDVLLAEQAIQALDHAAGGVGDVLQRRRRGGDHRHVAGRGIHQPRRLGAAAGELDDRRYGGGGYGRPRLLSRPCTVT